MTQFKKALVTGGAGFIGSHLVERLLDDGYIVTVIDDLSEGKWENLPKNTNLKKYKASILDNNVGKYFKDIDIVFHLAALPRLRRSVDDPRRTHDVNVNGTFNMLMLAKKHNVKRFVFASSSSVYGDQKTMPLTENMIPNPLVPYSLHKQIGEAYCKMFSDIWGLSTISLRFFNVYGTKMNPDSSYANLLPKFISQFKKGIAPVINGTGNHSRDFTYITDVVDAMIQGAESESSGDVFNVGYGSSISVNRVVTILNKLMCTKIKPTHGAPVIEPKKTLASNTKARKILGWKPKVSFEEGVKIMLHE